MSRTLKAVLIISLAINATAAAFEGHRALQVHDTRIHVVTLCRSEGVSLNACRDALTHAGAEYIGDHR